MLRKCQTLGGRAALTAFTLIGTVAISGCASHPEVAKTSPSETPDGPAGRNERAAGSPTPEASSPIAAVATQAPRLGDEKNAGAAFQPAEKDALRRLGYIDEDTADAVAHSSREGREEQKKPLAAVAKGKRRDGQAAANRREAEEQPRTRAFGQATMLASPPTAGLAELHGFGALPQAPRHTERYQHLEDNALKTVTIQPISTFSLDVDTGSYSNVRRFLAAGNRPPEDAVRIEELVNYFPYEYPRGNGQHPFGVQTELAPCPWNKDHWLMRVAVRADQVEAATMPPANLVFLVDVSGSMQSPDKLPLLRSSLKMLVRQLRSEDRVSLVVYAGRVAVVLEPTPGDQHSRIENAIDQLAAGGSTAGEAGIRLAYRMARRGFVQGGINRVLLATDGDFNVGLTDFEQVKDLVERERESGVQLTTLGFGTGNYNEALMEQIADVGNGSYAYIDTLQEGRKVLVDQVRSTLVTVAKDVKVQVEFNPTVVQEYRLLGYENRVLANEDFNNDRVDAGDVGAGQSVTALYELTPVDSAPAVDPLRYGSGAAARPVPEIQGSQPGEIAFVKLRYKQPAARVSRLVEVPVETRSIVASFEQAGDDFRFATAVAAFGQLLRGGRRTGDWSWDDVLSTATSARGRDEFGYRNEFVSLVRMAKISG